MKNSKIKCRACGRKWLDHKGVEPTCQMLQTALETLRQIAVMPRQRRARQLAGATVAFIETQNPKTDIKSKIRRL